MLPRSTRDLAIASVSEGCIFFLNFVCFIFLDGRPSLRDVQHCTCTCTRQFLFQPPTRVHCAHRMTLLDLPCTFPRKERRIQAEMQRSAFAESGVTFPLWIFSWQVLLCFSARNLRSLRGKVHDLASRVMLCAQCGLIGGLQHHHWRVLSAR